MTNAQDDRGEDGYRRAPGSGPRVRTDIVDVYVFCRVPASLGRVHRAPSPVFEPSGAGGTDGTGGRGGRGGSAGPMGGESFGAEVDRLYVLQLLRAKSPLLGAWHPIMGHIEAGETAAGCAAREMREEVGRGRRLCGRAKPRRCKKCTAG